MKKLLFFLAATAAFGQTVSNVTASHVSHGSILLHFDPSTTWTYLRVRFRPLSAGDCRTGSGGTVMETFYPNGSGGSSGVRTAPNAQIIVGGLTPGVVNTVCPELSNNGVTWSSGQGVNVTTLALPATHPALPITPATFDTSYPDMTGATTMTVGVDCANVSSCLDMAIANQSSSTGHHTIISLPAGSVWKGLINVTRRAVDTTNITAINTTTYTLTSAAHGLTEGEGIRFGPAAYAGCLPGSLTFDPIAARNGSGGQICSTAGPIIPGVAYYTHVVDANNFQVYAGAPLASGGTLCQFQDTGSGTAFWVRKTRRLKQIIIRTSTPDGQFAPEKTRISPAWLPKMATIMVPSIYIRGVTNANTLLSLNDFDGGNITMTANIRLVGLRLTYENDGTATNSMDNWPGYTLLSSSSTTQNVVVDRCIFDGNGIRVRTAFIWDGLNVAITDSYITGMNYGHAWLTGLGVS